MATRKCGVWLGILVLGSFLPAVLVKFGAGNSHICCPYSSTKERILKWFLADSYVFLYLVKLMMEKNEEKELFLVSQLFVTEE